MTRPYSIFIWHGPQDWQSGGFWEEPVQVANQEYALYLANLIHKDTHSVIKVVRYGLTIACFPDEKTVQRVEQPNYHFTGTIPVSWLPGIPDKIGR